MSDRLTGPSTGAAQIRDIVAQVVTSIAPPFGLTVWRARSWPLKEPSLPAALVYGYDEAMNIVSLTPADYQGTNVCQMVVQLVVGGADPIELETNLETLIGAVRTAVLQSQALGGETGAIERILSVRTTRQVKAESEGRLGEAHIVFEMQWSEEYTLQEDPITGVDLILTRTGTTVAEANITIPLGAT